MLQAVRLQDIYETFFSGVGASFLVVEIVISSDGGMPLFVDSSLREELPWPFIRRVRNYVDRSQERQVGSMMRSQTPAQAATSAAKQSQSRIVGLLDRLQPRSTRSNMKPVMKHQLQHINSTAVMFSRAQASHGALSSTHRSEIAIWDVLLAEQCSTCDCLSRNQ